MAMQFKELAAYRYQLPSDLIAQYPNVPRDGAKLLIYNRKTDQYRQDKFLNLPNYLPTNSLLVFNDTKVIPARIMAKRPTGGKCEVFVLNKISRYQYQALFSRYIPIGEELVLEGGLNIRVVTQKNQFFYFTCPLTFNELIGYLEKYGQMPVPPYIKKPDLNCKLKQEYQTVFAKKYGSVAAPTASLHFTNRLMQKIKQSGSDFVFVTLHVGLGTFAPITEHNFKTNKLHQEYYEISAKAWKTIIKYRRNCKKIIAVGTTAARTLESVTRTLELKDSTSLFIKPPYRFKLVSGLITNFHLPASSLLLLVSAFVRDRERTLKLYKYAVKERYRFYSFGDGMLIL